MLDIDEVEERKQKLINNATPAELFFKNKLDEWKIKYEFQYPIFINDGLTYYLDFYLPTYNVYVEIDGRHHLQVQETIIKDRFRKKSIFELYKIYEVRIKNKQAYKITFHKLIIKIKKSKGIIIKKKHLKKFIAINSKNQSK